MNWNAQIRVQKTLSVTRDESLVKKVQYIRERAKAQVHGRDSTDGVSTAQPQVWRDARALGLAAC
jgi:hypothetical protein